MAKLTYRKKTSIYPVTGDGGRYFLCINNRIVTPYNFVQCAMFTNLYTVCTDNFIFYDILKNLTFADQSSFKTLQEAKDFLAQEYIKFLETQEDNQITPANTFIRLLCLENYG